MSENRLAAYLEIGQIVSVHGIKGEVKVNPWCDDASLLCEFSKLYLDKNGSTFVDIKNSRIQKNMVIMKINGVDTAESAQKMRGKTLFAARREMSLADGVYFICDLLGMKVIDAETEQSYGKIYDVISTGANDVYCSRDEKRDYLFPAIPDVVINTDIENGVMLIKPLKGLFGDED